MGHDRKEKTYRTSDLAKQQGVHPNTVRLYEEWKLIPKAERTPGGYRIFTELHCRFFHLARLCSRFGFMGGKEARTAYDIICRAVERDWRASEMALRDLKEIVIREDRRARRALQILKDWSKKSPSKSESSSFYTTKEAVVLANITLEQLRHWERNHLIKPSRDSRGYRRMAQQDIHRLVLIATLRKARYSVQALLRMFRSFDMGYRGDFARWLNEPSESEGIVRATDRWLSTLEELSPLPEAIEEALGECKELAET